MKIGVLNELLSGITWNLTFADTGIVPETAEQGNPLKGETLLLKWNAIRDAGVELHIDLGKTCFVDRAVVRLGEETMLNSVSLSRPEGKLFEYSGETGKTISSRVLELEAGVMTDAVSVVLFGEFTDMEILSVELYGAVEDEVDLFPTPNQVTYHDKKAAASSFACFRGFDEDSLRAGEILAEKYLEITGVELAKAAGETADSAAAKGEILFVKDDSICADGYKLDITEESAVIAASNFRGFVCGAECFVKLTEEDGVHTCSIVDEPRVPFRGVHLFLPAAHQMDFAKRLIKYLISPMGYNSIIMEVAHGMKYKSHPEINEKVEEAIEKNKQGLWPPFPHGTVAEGVAVEHDVIKDYLSYVRSFGIEVIPEVQSLGHVPFMTVAHPEIAEVVKEKEENVDTREEDALPEVLFPHCYCPSNEKSYEILFDLLDEIIEVFEPKEYVHMGHDEVYYIGICPKCKEKSPAQLFADDVNRIYKHLQEKGLKMMIWADMLQPVTKYKTPAAIDMIPKDIVLLDFIWYFHLDKDIEENLLPKGFPVAYGNLYSSHFPRYESRIAKKGIVGGQISAWVETNEEALQREGKIYDFLMTAQLLWSRDYSHVYFKTYDKMISDRMPRLRDELRGSVAPSRRAGARTVQLLENAVAFPAVQPVEQTSSFAIEEKLSSLILKHTALRKMTREPWKKFEEIGTYVLTYEDGSVERVPVTNGGNIGYWNRHHNEITKHRFYRHNGYTSTYYTDGEEYRLPDGSPVTVYCYEHVLPEEKKLVSVALEQNSQYEMQVVLCKAEGVLA